MKVLLIGVFAAFCTLMAGTASFWSDANPTEATPAADLTPNVFHQEKVQSNFKFFDSAQSKPSDVTAVAASREGQAQTESIPAPPLRPLVSDNKVKTVNLGALPLLESPRQSSTIPTTTTAATPTTTSAARRGTTPTTSAHEILSEDKPLPPTQIETRGLLQSTSEEVEGSMSEKSLRSGQWDGIVSVGPPETCKDRLTAMLLSCQAVIQPPYWQAAYIVASRPYVAEYTELAQKYGGGLWQVLVEEELVPEFGNSSLKHLRPQQGWLRQQDVKLAFLARDGPSNTVLFDSDSLCSCATSWNKFAEASAKQDKLDMCVETWPFEPARSNMVATAKALGVEVPDAVSPDGSRDEKLPALIGWTPQVMSRAMFRRIISEHRPNLLRDLLELRNGPVCKNFSQLQLGARLRNRCWTEYFV